MERSSEEIRKDQQKEGKRMTLGLKDGVEPRKKTEKVVPFRDKSSVGRNDSRKPRNKRNSSIPKPRRLEGHEALLDGYRANNQRILMVLATSGEGLIGKIHNFDRYTITIHNGVKAICFFKNVIESITTLSDDEVMEVTQNEVAKV